MRISKEQAFLSFRIDPGQRRPTVSLHDNLSAVLSTWTSGTRVSPIWGLGTGAICKSNFSGKHELLFLGPVSPARVFAEINLRKLPGSLKAWVTLGTFNLLLKVNGTSAGKAALTLVRQWARKNNIPCEQWSVEDGTISSQKSHPIAAANCTLALKALSKIATHPFKNGLHIHAQEFLVLMASALTRSAAVDSQTHSEFISLADEVAESISSAIDHPDELLDVSAKIININAALSRYTSQSFSGISPISNTECHFWIHSLLGTGSANKALSNLVTSIATTLGRAKLPERFLALKRVTDGAPTYNELVRNDDFIWLDHIRNAPLDEADASEPLQPIITYYSGRDGYNSQLQTLSAPITSIAQANSRQTNILTVTHELSHVFVESILGYLYPDPDDVSEIAELTDFVRLDRKPASMFEAARKLLTTAVIAMQQLHSGKEIDVTHLTPERMLEMLTVWRREAKEIMVHTFDYLYFFEDKPEFYIESIWSTWCAIPGISERIPEYILRTMCAVSPRLLRMKPSERRAAALDLFRRSILSITKDSGTTTDYATRALKFVDENWEKSANGAPPLSSRYDIWLYLVRLTATFMYSESVAADLFSDRHVYGNATGYRKTPLELDDNPLGNPIRFVREHLKDNSEQAESLWLLHNVAYCLRR